MLGNNDAIIVFIWQVFDTYLTSVPKAVYYMNNLHACLNFLCLYRVLMILQGI